MTLSLQACTAEFRPPANARSTGQQASQDQSRLADTSGESSGWLTVPANSFEYYEVPVHTNLWRHMKYIVRLLEKPDHPINYRLAGELKTGLMAGRRVHISNNGEIIPGNFIPE